ncbi:MAG: hypothetical protein AAGD07_21755 [Planctomycetota bacterium]
MNERPFVPFTFYLADGNSVRVDQPYVIAARPNASFCMVFQDDGSISRVTLRNVTQVITDPTPDTPSQQLN